MTATVISLGEMLVEIMRKERDVPHLTPGEYLGPYPSGAPAIFIDAAARLGLSVGFIGVVGDDDFGRMLLQRLSEDGVDTRYVRTLPGYTTGTTFVMYYGTGERVFIFHLRHAAAGQLKPDDIDPRYLKGAKILLVMGSTLAVSDSSREACYEATRIAREANLKLVFDPNLRPELLDVDVIRNICRPVLESSDVIIPSGTEASVLTGVEEPIEAGRKLLELGPELAIIKVGEKGSLAISDGEILEGPAFRVAEVDPTGAGDVFDAAVACGLLKDWSLEQTLTFANAVGAIKVTRFGPMEGPKSVEEVRSFLVSNDVKAWF